MADKSDANSSKHQRRKSIPRRPENANPNYLKLILQSIGGKELSKTAVPVEFNEPLSMLQRQTEELEYAHLLDLAALEEAPDSGRRLAFICAFAISAYSTVGKRPTKPFNPILGETYECDRRTDRGWRLLAEQISHHPPGFALHAQGQHWTLEQQYLVESKLKSTNLCLNAIGSTTIRFKDGDAYTFGKLSTSTSMDSVVFNWSAKNGGTNTECSGELTVASLANSAKGLLTFHADKKGQQSKMVTGIVYDADGKEAYWLEAVFDRWARISKNDPTTLQDPSDFEQIWAANEMHQDFSQMHNFTQFAIELNEDEANVAPTDSRRRPDQRLCEMGQFEAANRLKKHLEEAQRKRLREMEKLGKEHRPLWFALKEERRKSNGMASNSNSKTKAKMALPIYTFTGEYWKAKETRNWEICPELFAV